MLNVACAQINPSFSWVWLRLTRRWNGESFSFRQASYLFQSLPRLDVLIAQIPGSFHLALVVVDLAMVAGGLFFFSSWRDIWETKRMKGRWTWPLITPFLFQVISSCNDECIDCSILVSDFLDSEEEISRFQANAVACKDYKSCIVGFFVAVFRWKIQTVDNPGADFLLETHHFQPIASSEKWWMCFPYPCHWFGKPRWFSGTPNSPRLLMVLLLRLLVVASEGRFLQRPTVGRIVAFCVLHLLFRSFWFYDPF